MRDQSFYAMGASLQKSSKPSNIQMLFFKGLSLAYAKCYFLSIFFVHGLMGDLRNTWQKNDILWPKDLLGTKLPKARIITYGYDADVVHLFSRTSKNTIFNHSQSLVKAVHRMKRSPSEVCKMKRSPCKFC
jgi:hypothetical protein